MTAFGCGFGGVCGRNRKIEGGLILCQIRKLPAQKAGHWQPALALLGPVPLHMTAKTLWTISKRTLSPLNPLRNNFGAGVTPILVHKHQRTWVAFNSGHSVDAMSLSDESDRLGAHYVIMLRYDGMGRYNAYCVWSTQPHPVAIFSWYCLVFLNRRYRNSRHCRLCFVLALFKALTIYHKRCQGFESTLCKLRSEYFHVILLTCREIPPRRATWFQTTRAIRTYKCIRLLRYKILMEFEAIPWISSSFKAELLPQASSCRFSLWPLHREASAPQPQRKENNQENFEYQTSPPESINVTP